MPSKVSAQSGRIVEVIDAQTFSWILHNTLAECRLCRSCNALHDLQCAFDPCMVVFTQHPSRVQIVQCAFDKRMVDFTHHQSEQSADCAARMQGNNFLPDYILTPPSSSSSNIFYICFIQGSFLYYPLLKLEVTDVF